MYKIRDYSLGLWFLGCLTLAPSYSAPEKPPAHRCDSLTRLRDEFTPSATSITQKELDELATEGDRQLYGPSFIPSMRFTVFFDGGGEPRIVFQNAKHYKFHSDFLQTLPQFKNLTHADLNEITVQGGGGILTGRIDFIQRTVEGQDPRAPRDRPYIGRFDILTQDSFSAERVKLVEELLKRSTTDLLHHCEYLPVREARAEVEQFPAKFEALGITVTQREARNATIAYSAGPYSVGRVKRIRAADLEAAIQRGEIHGDHILVMDEVPNELPPVAGVITGMESSPNSHVALFSQAQGNLFIYEPGAFESDVWKRYEKSGGNVLIRYRWQTAPSLWVNDRLTKRETEQLKKLKKPKSLGAAPRNTSLKKVYSVDELSQGDAATVGAKTANYAFLRQTVGPEHVHPAAAIPIHFFETFLDGASPDGAPRLRDYIRGELLKLEKGNVTDGDIIAALTRIQEKIKATKIPADMLSELFECLRRQFPDPQTRLRFRSSGTAEDLPGFNGAGLHSSTGLKMDSPEKLEKALKKVWASLYNPRAYLARRYFGVEEASVSMGVLVNPAFRGEEANGVSLFGAIPNASFPRIEGEVVSFPGEEFAVTNPQAGKIPESTRLVMRGPNLQHSVQVPSSELLLGRTVLTPAEYESLYRLMEKVHSAWPSTETLPTHKPRLDFEWKLMPEPSGGRRVFLKQVREVPNPDLGIESLRHRLVVGTHNLVLKSGRQEKERSGIAVLSQGLSLEISLAQFAVSEKLKEVSPVKKLKLTIGEKVLNFAPLEVEFIYRAEEKQQSREGDFRWHRVQIPLPNPVIPSLQLQLSISEETDADGRVREPLANFRELYPRFRAKLSDFPAFKKLPKNTTIPGARDGYWEWPAFNDDWAFKGNAEKFYPGQGYYSGNGIEFRINGQTAFSGLTKTMFLDLTQTEIKGLVPGTLVLTDPQAMVYTPNHHNLGWEYGFDLLRADDLTAEQRTSIEKLGRYLIIHAETFRTNDSTPTKAEYGRTIQLQSYNERGKLTPLGSLEGGENVGFPELRYPTP